MKQSFQRKDAKMQRREDGDGARALDRFTVCTSKRREKFGVNGTITLKRPEGRAPLNLASLHLCAFALNP
jgi:hypothetical protein